MYCHHPSSMILSPLLTKKKSVPICTSSEVAGRAPYSAPPEGVIHQPTPCRSRRQLGRGSVGQDSGEAEGGRSESVGEGEGGSASVGDVHVEVDQRSGGVLGRTFEGERRIGVDERVGGGGGDVHEVSIP